jgi:hypothetical protein
MHVAKDHWRLVLERDELARKAAALRTINQDLRECLLDEQKIDDFSTGTSNIECTPLP